LDQAQERYKKFHDAHVRLRNEKIQVGDLVFVKTFVTEPGRSPKLEFPAFGHFVVIGRDENTFLIKTASVKQRVSSDRVTRAPAPRDLPPEFQRDLTSNESIEDVETTEETVVDRVLSHGVNEDGQYMVRIRWHGQDKTQDTWQEASDLPIHFIERYARKKRLQVSDVLGVPAHVL
jgi:Chromo (CHRromatin Organisation MOdifier) domain